MLKANYKKLNSLIFLVSLMLFVIALSNIYLYNQTVNLKHLIKKKEQEVQGLQLANADAKNTLFKLIGSESLNEIQKEKDWRKFKNQEFLEINE